MPCSHIPDNFPKIIIKDLRNRGKKEDAINFAGVQKFIPTMECWAIDVFLRDCLLMMILIYPFLLGKNYKYLLPRKMVKKLGEHIQKFSKNSIL